MLKKLKQTKYTKIKKRKLLRYKYKSNFLTFGKMGLKTIESGFLNHKQIESARQTMARQIKRKGKIWIKIFYNTSVTFKPTNSRMGKGKGSIFYWAARIKSGSIIFEILGIDNEILKSALLSGSKKLPIKTKIIYY